MASAIGIAALAYFTMQAAPQAQLFAGLGDADKAAVAEALQSQGIAPSVDSSTGALTVDADKLHQARLELAGQGLPKAAPRGGSRPRTDWRTVVGRVCKTVWISLGA